MAGGIIKTSSEILKIRAAGKILAKVLQELAAVVDDGITEQDLDRLAHNLIIKAGGEPAFLGYQPGGAAKPYPATLCVSLNDVVVHGVPGRRRIKKGDIVKLDLGVRYQGYCADAAITVAIGEIPPKSQELIHATKKALDAAIIASKAGNTLGDIGYIIEKTAKDHGFSVLKGLTGHGIGTEVHEEPTVLNEGHPGKGMRLRSGMVLAIEPMFSTGSNRVKQLNDESYATVDGSLSAHFEHTILITERGAEVLTII